MYILFRIENSKLPFSQEFLYISSQAFLMSCFVGVHWNAKGSIRSFVHKSTVRKRDQVSSGVLTLWCGLISGLLRANTKHAMKGRCERQCQRPPSVFLFSSCSWKFLPLWFNLHLSLTPISGQLIAWLNCLYYGQITSYDVIISTSPNFLSVF